MRTTRSLMLAIIVLVITCSSAIGIQGQSSQFVCKDAEVVAIVNGKYAITKKELDKTIDTQLFELEMQIYNLRVAALEKLLTGKLLEYAAQLEGISLEEYLNRLTSGKVEIGQKEVDRAYLENKDAISDMEVNEAKQRIRLDLEAKHKVKKYKATIDALRSKSNISIRIVKPELPVVTASTDGPWKGNKDAPVTIVEFSNFTCPFCKNATGLLDQILHSYKDDVKLVYKHMPLPTHPEAYKAAQAAVCADKQGKFWEYHDRLFNAKELNEESLKTYAMEIELKLNEFNACMKSEDSSNRVDSDILEAKRLNVKGTPTFFINGKVMQGLRNIDDIKSVIDQELVNSKNKSSQGSRKIP